MPTILKVSTEDKRKALKSLLDSRIPFHYTNLKASNIAISDNNLKTSIEIFNNAKISFTTMNV